MSSFRLSQRKRGPQYHFFGIRQTKRWQRTGAPAPKVEGQFETLTGTQVRSGPGLNYPLVAEIGKGTKINVVGEENGWLKVESKHGNKPGYVDASLAKPSAGR